MGCNTGFFWGGRGCYRCPFLQSRVRGESVHCRFFRLRASKSRLDDVCVIDVGTWWHDSCALKTRSTVFLDDSATHRRRYGEWVMVYECDRRRRDLRDLRTRSTSDVGVHLDYGDTGHVLGYRFSEPAALSFLWSVVCRGLFRRVAVVRTTESWYKYVDYFESWV